MFTTFAYDYCKKRAKKRTPKNRGSWSIREYLIINLFSLFVFFRVNTVFFAFEGQGLAGKPQLFTAFCEITPSAG